MISRTIIFYIATLTRGGAERVMVSLANYCATVGDDVTLVTLEPDEGLYEIDNRVNHIVLDSTGEGRIKAAIGRISKVRRLIKEKNADAVVGFIGKTNIRTILAGLGTTCRTVVSIRSTPAREYKGFANNILAHIIFPFADGVVFQTEAARNFFGPVVRKKSAILPNPLSKEYVYAYTERDFGTNINSVRRIVTVGRMDPVKNHMMLVEAFKKVTEKQNSVVLSIYGDGECRAEVETLANKLGIADKVHLPGDTKNVKSHIKDASLFVLSSNFEGMPNAIAEAQALGIPVVSTDCPNGARALIENEVTGLLVPVGDAEAMSQAILRVLTDPKLAESLSKKGYESARRLYPDIVHKNWRKFIYNEVDNE